MTDIAPPPAVESWALIDPAQQARPWYTLTQGERRSRELPEVRTRSVVLQVLAAAAVVLAVVGVTGAFISRRVAEREAVTDAAQEADLIADAVIQPTLDYGLVSGQAASVKRMDDAVRGLLLSKTSSFKIVRVKIWDPTTKPQATIVYSDVRELMQPGQNRYALDPEELEVLEPGNSKTRAEVSDLSKSENRFERVDGKLLEVYRPIWVLDPATNSYKTLLFEIYQPYDQVTTRSVDMWRAFAGITLSSLLLLVVFMMPVLWRLMDRIRSAQRQREDLLQRAVEASDAERRRIAGTLHDGVVQELAATSFSVAGAAGRAREAGEPDLAHQLERAAGAVRVSIRGLRSLLVDIYPPNLSSSGLEEALEDLTAVLRSRGTSTSVEADQAAADALDAEGQRLVYRVAQECLRNIDRHSAASDVVVRLYREQGWVVLEVEDDGSGFDAPAVLGDPREGHFGLRVLADLAADHGAALRLSTAAGAGCLWRLEVPAR